MSFRPICRYTVFTPFIQRSVNLDERFHKGQKTARRLVQLCRKEERKGSGRVRWRSMGNGKGLELGLLSLPVSVADRVSSELDHILALRLPGVKFWTRIYTSMSRPVFGQRLCSPHRY
ncbi:hypothetical protein LZ32DRAFT_610306 [Colletotrichum eremochloae]|nr:hypothetical protein LZ32DRAFT_610306 [Colletotrichum eremochloae]